MISRLPQYPLSDFRTDNLPINKRKMRSPSRYDLKLRIKGDTKTPELDENLAQIAFKVQLDRAERREAERVAMCKAKIKKLIKSGSGTFGD